MGSPTQATALALIAEGGVSADQYESIFLPNTVNVAVVGELRLLIVVAIAQSLAYRAAPAGAPGVHPVLLTTLGEVVLYRSNPARYQSTHAYEISDGKVQATEVAR